MSSNAQGILTMESTLIGIVKIKPKQLLLDGIKYELKTRLYNIYNNIDFKVDNKTKNKSFHKIINDIAILITGLYRAIE